MSWYVNQMEQIKLTDMKNRYPGWIWNRSDTHTFLAVPGTHEAYKTVVEPGNTFSPGPATYGVSVWLYDEKLHTVEEMKLEEFKTSFKSCILYPSASIECKILRSSPKSLQTDR